MKALYPLVACLALIVGPQAMAKPKPSLLAHEVINIYYSTAAKTKEVGRRTRECNGQVTMEGIKTKFVKNMIGETCPNPTNPA